MPSRSLLLAAARMWRWPTILTNETFTTAAGIQGGINSTPLKRGGTPDDVANAVLYFATELGSFITGEIIDINGGMYFA